MPHAIKKVTTITEYIQPSDEVDLDLDEDLDDEDLDEDEEEVDEKPAAPSRRRK